MTSSAPAERPDTAVLDLDGTLVDTVYQHVVAWRSAFLEVGVDVPAWQIHSAIGIGGDRLVAEVAGQKVEEAVGDAVRQRHAEKFERLLPQVTCTEGASEFLEALRRADLKVVVASSGEAEVTERLLDIVGPGESVHDWVSGDQVEDSKPAGDLITAALERVSGRSAVVVGDTVWDVRSAQDVGFPCVGLLTGGISETTLWEAGATDVFESPAAISRDLARLWSAARS